MDLRDAQATLRAFFEDDAPRRIRLGTGAIKEEYFAEAVKFVQLGNEMLQRLDAEGVPLTGDLLQRVLRVIGRYLEGGGERPRVPRQAGRRRAPRPRAGRPPGGRAGREEDKRESRENSGRNNREIGGRNNRDQWEGASDLREGELQIPSPLQEEAFAAEVPRSRSRRRRRGEGASSRGARENGSPESPPTEADIHDLERQLEMEAGGAGEFIE